MEQSSLNCPVTITALGFGPGLRAYPKRMEWQGKTYHFLSHGLRLNVRRGESRMSTVTCSDGRREYYLREQSGAWTLVGMGA